MSNRVNHPQHYQGANGIECIDIIRHYTCDIANAQKYLMRAGHKPEQGMTQEEKEIEDLKKSLFYIDDYRQHPQHSRRHGERDTKTMLRRLRKVTGHTAEQIVAGHPKPIADAIQLLLAVGIIDAGKVYADICWEVCLEQATAAIQQRIADLQTETVSKDCADIRQYIGKLIMLNYDLESCLAFVEGIEKCSDGKEYADFCNIVGSSWGLRMDSDFTFRPATDLDINRAVIDRCKDVAESYGYKF